MKKLCAFVKNLTLQNLKKRNYCKGIAPRVPFVSHQTLILNGLKLEHIQNHALPSKLSVVDGRNLIGDIFTGKTSNAVSATSELGKSHSQQFTLKLSVDETRASKQSRKDETTIESGYRKLRLNFVKKCIDCTFEIFKIYLFGLTKPKLTKLDLMGWTRFRRN